MNQQKDPFEPTSMMEYHKGFECFSNRQVETCIYKLVSPLPITVESERLTGSLTKNANIGASQGATL